MHDFVSFTDDDREEGSTKVLINDVQLKIAEKLILIRFTGSHFLWKMVRRMTGVLSEIGRGKLSDKDLIKYLTTKTNEPAKYTAPPSGLFLERILYKGDIGKKDFEAPIKFSNI
jgi:tRNA pseudouridine38-40 synthase